MIAIFDEEYVDWCTSNYALWGRKADTSLVEVERSTFKNLLEVWALLVVKEVVMRSWDVSVKARATWLHAD